jgi:hypothetical protein
MSENQQVVPPAPPVPPAEAPQTSGKAIVSLVFGILAFFPLPFIGTIVALITGYSARSEIKGSDRIMKGDGMALTGIILGWVSIGLIVVPVCIIVILVLLGPAIGSVFSGITESI